MSWNGDGYCDGVVNLRKKVAGWRANLFAIEVLCFEKYVNKDELKTSFFTMLPICFSCFEMSVLKFFAMSGVPTEIL